MAEAQELVGGDVVFAGEGAGQVGLEGHEHGEDAGFVVGEVGLGGHGFAGFFAGGRKGREVAGIAPVEIRVVEAKSAVVSGDLHGRVMAGRALRPS